MITSETMKVKRVVPNGHVEWDRKTMEAKLKNNNKKKKKKKKKNCHQVNQLKMTINDAIRTLQSKCEHLSHR